jgi:hypothetical protein
MAISGQTCAQAMQPVHFFSSMQAATLNHSRFFRSDITMIFFGQTPRQSPQDLHKALSIFILKDIFQTLRK